VNEGRFAWRLDFEEPGPGHENKSRCGINPADDRARKADSPQRGTFPENAVTTEL
jgi:hypothetical protein